MTERQKQMIEAYIPHPRDATLGFNEYYVKDTAERIRKVFIRDILPHDFETTYGVYEVSSGRRIDAGWGNEFVGFPMRSLYDNKQDCKDDTHLIYNDWEALRKLQEEEANEDCRC